MIIVPFAEQHIGPFSAWFNALPHNAVWTEGSVGFRSIQDETYDPALMIAVEESGSPCGFVLGSIANETGWIRAFVVRSDRQGQGIGTAMFDAVERAFAERGIAEVNVGRARPRTFLPGIDITYTSAIVFLDRRGYQTSREARVNMEVVLCGRDFGTRDDRARLHEQGITVRRAQPQDRLGITRLCEAHNYPNWAAGTCAALDDDSVTVFVAEREDEICAFAALSIDGPIHFGPILTAGDLRGRGIGSVILKHCLQDGQRAGAQRCEIVSAGPLSFYARSVGATMGRAFWTIHKSLQ